jgi:NADPH:quinone reductase-like Zn-dependent oxidoreductase
MIGTALRGSVPTSSASRCWPSGPVSSRVNRSLDGRASIAGTNDADGTAGLQHLVDLVTTGELEIPIAVTYPLADIRKAYQRVAEQRTHGKIVLIP